MRPEELVDIIGKRPFQPIRLHMSTGEAVDITHPEAAIVARTTVVVARGMNQRHIADSTTWYNLLHIVKVEQLGAPEGENGQQRKSA